MSSTYGLICLHHDPGIELGDHTLVYDRDIMVAAAKDPVGHDLEAHAHCDLVVARYSYPIVEIGCPGASARKIGCGWHPGAHWVDADWIRLLAAAYQARVPEWVTEPFSSRCWKPERTRRLGPVLGLIDQKDVDDD